jgi:hypothetical protein
MAWQSLPNETISCVRCEYVAEWRRRNESAEITPVCFAERRWRRQPNFCARANDEVG